MEAETKREFDKLWTLIAGRFNEMDALRLVTQALLGVVSLRNDLSPEFAAAFVRVLHADEAVMLNTRASDGFLEQRREMMFRLLPENVKSMVQRELQQSR